MNKFYTTFLFSIVVLSGFSQTFVETTVAGLTGEAHNSLAIAVGDYDKDGHEDIFVGNYSGGQNFLYKNNGDGTFTRMNSLAPSLDYGSTTGAVWIDHNNDSYLDLYVSNWNEDNFLYTNNGDGTFIKETSHDLTIALPSESFNSAWADYDRDGFQDIYVPDNSGISTGTLLRNNGDGTFSEDYALGSDNLGTNSAVWVDYNRDRFPDLFLANSTRNQLFQNNQNGTFTEIFSNPLVTDAFNSWSSSWGYLDSNTWPDVLNSEPNLNSLYFGSTFIKGFGDITVKSGNEGSSAIGDYDNDGDNDIVVSSTNSLRLYTNNGSGSFTYTDINTIYTLYGTVFMDMNQDGYLDIVTTDLSTGGVRVFENRTSNTNHYVRIKLEGVEKNGSALGANMILYTATGTYFQQKVSANGWGSDGPGYAHFGIGTATEVSQLIVQWPDGTNTYYYDIEVDELNVIRGMGPNIVPTLYESLHTKVKRGNSWLIEYYVHNNSDYPVGEFSTEYYVSTDNIIDETDYKLDSVYYSGLDPYSGEWKAIYPVLPNDFPLGSYYFILDVDSEDEVKELDEEDNLIIHPIEVTDQDFPNLTGYFGLNSSYYNSGTPINFNYAYVYNQSNIPVNDITVNFLLSQDDELSSNDSLLSSQTVSLNSYETVYLNTDVHVPESMPLGTYYVLMIIDAANELEEKTELDNSRYQWVSVTDNPVSASNLAGSPVSTSQIDLTWTDNSTVETSYEVYRDNILIATLPADTEYYSDPLVSPGIAYTYYVRTVNAISSANSGSINVTIDNSTEAEILVLATSGNLVNDGGSSLSSAWGDYDNDNDQDLFISNSGQANFLYQNNGDGTFTKITTGNIVTDINNSVNASWADFNNDGWLDLYVSNHGEDNKLYKNNGDGTFSDVASSALVAHGGNQGCAWADYDQDGWVDLFTTSLGGVNNNLFHNNGDGTFTAMSITGMTDSGGESVNALWFDANNDSWPDLFVVNDMQANQLFMNQGTGNFSKFMSGALANDVEASSGASVGDYDNNGYLDLYVTNRGQSNSLYYNSYGSGFQKVNIGTSGGLANSESSSWADFDNDGDQDLFVANAGNNNMLFRNNGNNSFTRLLVGNVVNEGSLPSTSASWADVNNDGFQDLIVTNAADENNLLYINSGNGNNFLTVKLIGVSENISAIGARAYVQYTSDGNSFYQTKQVLAQTGSRGQNTLELHFGLGNASEIEYFEIAWPNNQNLSYSIESINERITILGMGPDIRATVNENTKTIVKQGDILDINANVRNLSSYPIGAFKVAYYFSLDSILNTGDILFDTISVTSLAAYNNAYVGRSKQVSQTLPLGDYRLIMKADYQDAIDETNEVNNIVVRDITVTDVDLGDLVTYVRTTRGNYNPGTTIEINGYITNDSEVDLAEVPFLIVYSEDEFFSVEDDIILDTQVISLDANERHNIETTYDIDPVTPQGYYYVILVADPEDVVLESLENNNRFSWYTFVSDYPAQPTNLSTSVAAIDQIDLSWQDNSNNEDNYIVVRNDIEIATLGPDVTTYSDTDVQIDVEYTYYVIAENTFGTSWQSNQATGLIANIPELLIPETTDVIANDGGSSSGMAWGDYNNDDFVDLFVANNGESSFLYTNNGDGSFTKVTGGTIVTTIANSISASWADYNNDGWLDLYVVNDGQNNFLYKNNANGTFSNVTSTAGVPDGNMSSVWGDYNNDGWVDLYVTNDDNVDNVLYKNNGDGTFTSEIITGPTTSGGNSKSANWVDVNNDGNLDLFVVNYQQANQLFINNGDGSFNRINSGEIVSDVENSWGASWADYDNDGYIDVFVTNKNGNNSLYRNQYDGTFLKVINDDIVQDGANSESSTWGDYDNDGDLDIFVANILQNNILYQNDGNGTFTKIVLGTVVNEGAMISTSCGFADVNNDGFLDLFVTNAAGQNNLLYINATNGNNWIKLKLTGVNENTAAIGSSIALSSSQFYQTRQIATQTGGRAQESMEVHFGLGSLTSIYEVRISWPNGEWQSYNDLQLGQLNKINGMGIELQPYFYERDMPVKVKRGTEGYIQAFINNQTAYPADSVYYNVYLSEDNIIDGTDYLLIDSTTYDVASYSNNYFYSAYTIPSDFQTGEYIMILEIDSENWHNEINEENNQIELAFTVVDYDLSELVTFSSISNFTNNPGADLEFSVYLENESESALVDVPLNYYLSNDSELSVDDELIMTDTVDFDGYENLEFDTTYALSYALTPNIYYLIIVLDEANVIEESNEVNNFAIRPFAVVLRPADPSGFTASASQDDEIYLSWQDNSNNEEQYVIERDFVQIAMLGADEIAFTDVGLELDVRYEYRVRATNSTGNSAWRIVNFTLLTPPTGLVSEVTPEGGVKLNWIDNSTRESGYEIYRNGESFDDVGAGVIEYIDEAVSIETSYSYKVLAFDNDNGHSNYSNEVIVEFLAAPTTLSATSTGAGQVHLNWTDNSGMETGYIIARNGVELSTLSVDANEFTDSGLDDEVLYNYTVWAISSNGSSLPSEITYAILAAPTTVGAEVTAENQVTISWTDNSSLEQAYEIYRDAVLIGSVGNDVTEFVDSEITGEGTFVYQVKALGDNSESQLSDPVEIGMLSSPSDLTLSLQPANQLKLDWTDNSSNELGYSIERDGTEIGTTASNIQEFTDDGITPENLYSYRVKAFGTNAFSGYSAETSFRLLANPSGLSSEVGGINEIALSWLDNSASETNYEIFKDNALIATLDAGTVAYSDADVSPENNYSYKIRAIAADGSSDFSSAVTQRILNTPTSLTATEISKTQIRLTWVDNSSHETMYVIERNGSEVGTASANVGEFLDNGLATDIEYIYRVKASGNGTDESVFSEPFSITINPDSEGPEINVVTNVDSHVTGASSQFTLEVTDELSEVSEVRAYYKKMTSSAAGAFTSVILPEGTANDYTFSLTDNMFDELGLFVVFEGKDAYNNLSQTDTLSVYLAYGADDVSVTGLKNGSEVSSYQIFSVPLDLANKNVESIFTTLGGYDDTKWRVFRYMSGENKEYKSGFTTLDRGKGYWLISSEIGNTMSLGEGNHELPNDQPFALQLQSGWNQIGNPYMFNVSWADVLEFNSLTSAELSNLQVFNNGSFTVSDILRKFQGGFVNATSSMTIQIPYEKDPSIQGGKLTDHHWASEGSTEDKNWMLALALEAGEINYTVSGVGMHPKAHDSRDRYDELTAPRFMGYLELNFMHPENNWPYFAKDVVSSRDNFTWEFTVETNFDIENLLLKWDNSIINGNNKKLVLVDVISNRVIDMASQQEYTFTYGGVHPFRIVYGDTEYVMENTLPLLSTILSSYPNPFVDEINIPYVLKESNFPYQVELTIYSLSGEEIFRKNHTDLSAGYHQFIWDGKSSNGNDLPSGVYLQQLTVINGKGKTEYRSKIMKR